MGDFKKFNEAVKARYNEMAKGELFIVDIEDIFASYLAAFPEGTNPIFRERTEHDCNCCKNFIHRLGCIVSLDEQLNIQTVWDDWQDLPFPYNEVGCRMQAVVKQAPIISIFRTKEHSFGAAQTPDNYENILWEHFHGRVAPRHKTSSPQEVIGKAITGAQTLARALQELKPDALETVIDLIKDRALYRGEEHLSYVQSFCDLQKEYIRCANKGNFVHAHCDSRAAGFRNSVIGTLVVALSDGVDIEVAVKQYESKVAPYNYKRPKSLITPKMIEGAVAKLEELGLAGAVQRRVAFISDVSVNDVLWADRGTASKMKDGITELLMPASTSKKVNIGHASPIDAEDFLMRVVPGAESMDLLVQNRHLNKFVSITGTDDTAPLFKWHNGFGWSYDGDVTDSIKERVKKAGGNIDANLRISLAWHNGDDLDIHIQCPRGHIYYGNKMGVLDVDMNAGGATNRKDPVENMSFHVPPKGQYKVTVNQYHKRSTANPGFEIELSTHGKSEFFSFKGDLSTSQSQEVFSFRIDENQIVKDLHVAKGMERDSSSQTKWGIQTENWVPVDTLMFSPNYWGGNAVGNKHWMFILRGCANPEPTRGIYNEFLRGDLEPHRKVFEVLGSKTKCEPHPDGLAGLGFSSTWKDDCIILVKNGSASRAYNVKF